MPLFIDITRFPVTEVGAATQTTKITARGTTIIVFWLKSGQLVNYIQIAGEFVG